MSDMDLSEQGNYESFCLVAIQAGLADSVASADVLPSRLSTRETDDRIVFAELEWINSLPLLSLMLSQNPCKILENNGKSGKCRNAESVLKNGINPCEVGFFRNSC